MTERIKIIDESGDKKYFSQLPHYILNHSTAIDQALYWQMKRYAGENGTCFATEKTLMAKMGIGKKAYNKSLNYLLEKKWIKFIGTTKGKTRPIRTYAIVDIWKLNILNYEKISAESTLSIQEISAESEGDKCQKHTKISAESTLEEELIKEEHNNNIILHSEANASQPLNETINLFQPLNPLTYKKWFANKTQRAAVERLLKLLGCEKIKLAVEAAVKVQSMKFAPIISTPLQLEDKLNDLRNFIIKEKQNSKWHII